MLLQLSMTFHHSLIWQLDSRRTACSKHSRKHEAYICVWVMVIWVSAILRAPGSESGPLIPGDLAMAAIREPGPQGWPEAEALGQVPQGPDWQGQAGRPR